MLPDREKPRQQIYAEMRAQNFSLDDEQARKTEVLVDEVWDEEDLHVLIVAEQNVIRRGVSEENEIAAIRAEFFRLSQQSYDPFTIDDILEKINEMDDLEAEEGVTRRHIWEFFKLGECKFDTLYR